MTWQDEDNARDLNTLISNVYPVEELNIALIVEICEEQEIEHRKFVSAWEALLDEAHEIINRAEDKL
jgi:hypothetical protein